MKLSLTLVLASALACSASAVTHAGILHYQITAGGPPIDLFVDDSMTDSDSSSTRGLYVQPASITPPAYPGRHDPYYRYTVVNDSAADRIIIELGSIQTVTSGSGASVPPGDYEVGSRLEFVYPASQFSSDAFHGIDFPAGSATVMRVDFDSLPPSPITSVTLIVPEPASLGLLASGALALRRSRR